MANKRSMKVYGMSGYEYQQTPTIMLKGKWLEQLNFHIGDYVTISCEDGKLIIIPDTERAAMAKAEAEFMEREMKSLQKRFEAEKKKIHLQFVAGRKADRFSIQSGIFPSEAGKEFWLWILIHSLISQPASGVKKRRM